MEELGLLILQKIRGGWTPSSGLKQSSATELIESQHIRSLTASKITAGTINAHEIILKQQGPQTVITAPANIAIIRSSNYNGSYNSGTGIWTNGTAGWVISGEGHAEFSSASIRGTVKAGSVFIDANNRWKTSQFGDQILDPVFKVGTSSSYVFYNGIDALEVKGTIRADAGQIAGFQISGDNIVTGGNYNGAMIVGPGTGPLSIETGGPTGQYMVEAGVSPGNIAKAQHNSYWSRWSREYSNGQIDYSLDVKPDGIVYQYNSSNRFNS